MFFLILNHALLDVTVVQFNNINQEIKANKCEIVKNLTQCDKAFYKNSFLLKIQDVPRDSHHRWPGFLGSVKVLLSKELFSRH